MKRVVLGAFAYLMITFPLAVVWHIVAFKSIYGSLGYFSREEPNFALGFLSVAIQGTLLSYGYPLFCPRNRDIWSAIKYVALAGTFFWTCYVVASAAKQEISSVLLFFTLETAFLLLQFGFFGLVICNNHSYNNNRIYFKRR
ncbi:MAG: hypothetical protein L0Y56_10625 [Nitrospira sp.]|nr:hypothetical protein [Nitrospira sp.]